MEGSKLLTMIVTVTVGIIFTGALLGPVINDASETEKTFTNAGYYRMAEIDEGTPMAIVWDYTDPTSLTVNSVKVELPDQDEMSTIPFTIFCSQTWYMRYGYENGYYVNIYQNANNTSYSGTVTDSRSLTVTVTDEGFTTVNNGTEHTWSNAAGGFYVVSPTGDYVMKNMGENAYVHGDSPIFGYGRTYARSYNYTSELSGTVNDGITGAYYPETTITATGWTISDVTLNSTQLTKYNDLYEISTMTYEITGEGIQPYTAIYSQYIVPYQVTAELSQHLDASEIAILAAIPLMAIAALVLLVVRYFVAGRD